MSTPQVVAAKKPYTAPRLVRVGDIATLTTQSFKQFGLGDGFYLLTPQGPVPIENAS